MSEFAAMVACCNDHQVITIVGYSKYFHILCIFLPTLN